MALVDATAERTQPEAGGASRGLPGRLLNRRLFLPLTLAEVRRNRGCDRACAAARQGKREQDGDKSTPEHARIVANSSAPRADNLNPTGALSTVPAHAGARSTGADPLRVPNDPAGQTDTPESLSLQPTELQPRGEESSRLRPISVALEKYLQELAKRSGRPRRPEPMLRVVAASLRAQSGSEAVSPVRATPAPEPHPSLTAAVAFIANQPPRG